MKVQLLRVRPNFSEGISKKGRPYKIDDTVITVGIKAKGGYKPKDYIFGTADQASTLDSLLPSIPCEVDIDVDVTLNEFDGEVDIITDIRTPLLKVQPKTPTKTA